MGRYFWDRATLTAAAGLVFTSVLAAGCQNGPFLQTEQFVTRDGQEEQVGMACMSVDKGSGLGGGRAPGVPGAAGDGAGEAAASGHSFSYEGTGNGVRLTVADGAGITLAQRTYDSAFIDSRRKDELTVELEGETLRFVARGIATCGE